MQYVAPTDSIEKIDEEIDTIREVAPLVLINAGERVRLFKADHILYELVSSMPVSTALDTHRIETVVARYFHYVVFSHVWEGKGNGSE